MIVISKSQLAGELGISRARVSQYVKEGLPIRKDGKIDRESALNWIARNIVPADVDEDKGAMRAGRLANGPARQDFSKGPPVPWLQPVHDAEDRFDKGVLFAVLAMARKIEALAAMAAHDAGAPAAIAKLAGEIMAVAFVEQACEFMVENDIGPFAHDCDAPIWPKPGDVDMHVDWKRAAEDAGEPYEPKKWDAYAKAQKAKLRKAARNA